jgi:hypothetical protein
MALWKNMQVCVKLKALDPDQYSHYFVSNTKLGDILDADPDFKH